jgi:hypothetical protein
MCADRLASAALRARRHCGGQTGQAFAETIVFVALASLLALCILAIGRIQSLQLSAQDAARALALECRLAAARCDDAVAQARLADEIRLRFFPVSVQSRSAAGREAVSEDFPSVPAATFWRNADGGPMVENVSAIRLHAGSVPLDAGINTAAAGRESIANALSRWVGPQRFGFDPRSGLRVARVDVPATLSLSSVSAQSSSEPLRLNLSARLAVVGDDWSAATTFGAEPDSVESRVVRGRQLDSARESVLQAGYALTRGSLKAFDTLGLEPGAAALLNHRLDVSIIPADRRP